MTYQPKPVAPEVDLEDEIRTALAELRQVPGATGATGANAAQAAADVADVAKLWRLERDEARAALARVEAHNRVLSGNYDDLRQRTEYAADRAKYELEDARAMLRLRGLPGISAPEIPDSSELAKVTAERDTLTAELAAVRRTLSAETSREQSAHEVTKRGLVEAQQAVVEISGHLSRERAVVEAARAALADREHLEEGARLLRLAMDDTPAQFREDLKLHPAYAAGIWFQAERARQSRATSAAAPPTAPHSAAGKPDP